MTWLAQSDRMVEQRKFGSHQGTGTGADPAALMVQGSIIVDLDFALSNQAPCKLISYVLDKGWRREFTVFLNADLSLSVEVIQGQSRCYGRLVDCKLSIDRLARLTYAWDTLKKTGKLSLHNAQSGKIHQATIAAPIPIPTEDAIAIVGGNQVSEYDPRTRSLALSDSVVPVGRMASIAGGGLVDTTQGVRAIERLQLGDLVLTQGGEAAPVRWIVKQELPAVGGAAPMRLRAPFFGLARDLVVSGDQHVLISESGAEYQFGKSAMLIEARNLIGHPGVTRMHDLRTVTYYQILLDQHSCISVSGAWVDSLYVGTVAKMPEILATTALSQVPLAVLPVHRTQVHPTAQDFERRALLDTLTA